MHIHIHGVTSEITPLVLTLVVMVGVICSIYLCYSEVRWSPHIMSFAGTLLSSLSLQVGPDSCYL